MTNEYSSWDLDTQREHDKSRNVRSTISYFYDNENQLQKVSIDEEKSSKLRLRRNDRTANLQDLGLPDEARLGRIDVTLVNTQKPEDIQAIFIGGIHADESTSPNEWEKSTSTYPEMSQLPRAEIMEAHDVATMLGRRDNLVPIDEQELESLQLQDLPLLAILPKGGNLLNDEKVFGLDMIVDAWTEEEKKQAQQYADNLKDEDEKSINYSRELKIQKAITKIGRLIVNDDQNSRQIAQEEFDKLKPFLKEIILQSKNFVIGKKVNLNRQFPINEEMTFLDQIKNAIKYPEAKLLVQATADLPNAKFIFSMHEDPEYEKDNGEEGALDSDEGFYFYDSHYSYNEDLDRDLILQLKEELAKALKENKFYIMSGIDDPNDPSLGFIADHGYIDQPIIGKTGEVDGIDGTYESAMVAMGQKGLLKIERAFCFEIPGKISSERKRKLLTILQEEFILPFLKAKGVKALQ